MDNNMDNNNAEHTLEGAERLAYARLLSGCERYAQADASDPYALKRATLHLRMGLCAPLQDGSDGGYDATRTPDGFINRSRP